MGTLVNLGQVVLATSDDGIVVPGHLLTFFRFSDGVE